MCITGKRGYENEAEALEAIEIMNHDNPNRKEGRAYWCHLCYQWHLTSQQKKRK